MPKTPSPSEWRRVSRRHPCPVCGRRDWCGVSADGEFAICMRVESDRPTKNGGWLHRLGDGDRPLPPPPRPKRRAPPLLLVERWRRWRDRTTPSQVAHLADSLGVDAEALTRLGAACTPEYGAWAFPMRDAEGHVIGIRLRGDGGRKWAVRGSRSGLFFDPAADGDLWLICEGPTDTAAAMALGFATIGRPSCCGGTDLLKSFFGRRRTDVVIVADRDGPGLQGAQRLAKDLRRPIRIVTPPVKDMREWVKTGATPAVVTAAVASAAWLNVR